MGAIDNIDFSVFGESTSDQLLPESTWGKGFYTGDRSFVGDITSALSRGVMRTVSSSAHAYETMTGDETGLNEWADKKVEETEFLQPDRPEYFGNQGFVKDAAMSTAESLPMVFAPLLAGIAGSVVGTPAVGMGAALATTGALFGAGTYGESKQIYLKENPGDVEGAHQFGIRQGLT
ncbi:MAG: hypothetical protein DRP42_06960, partial [Tenericutes bacterium]